METKKQLSSKPASAQKLLFFAYLTYFTKGAIVVCERRKDDMLEFLMSIIIWD